MTLNFTPLNHCLLVIWSKHNYYHHNLLNNLILLFPLLDRLIGDNPHMMTVRYHMNPLSSETRVSSPQELCGNKTKNFSHNSRFCPKGPVSAAALFLPGSQINKYNYKLTVLASADLYAGGDRTM